ncbi:hypothetical protein HMPREF9442_00381 [Paraprevotella xylaniphila YIT 11841]|uniref:Uncharacterized protein n=1 Tax=Paraprevotella xylaniphila YIT 11841 TaxID=762982 RepID=F3QQE3_9BACT|nr:hypothetical protein HMPREF9442_00381 [Paraprevotella xylaniphila YIT 11841]
MICTLNEFKHEMGADGERRQGLQSKNSRTVSGRWKGRKEWVPYCGEAIPFHPLCILRIVLRKTLFFIVLLWRSIRAEIKWMQ